MRTLLNFDQFSVFFHCWKECESFDKRDCNFSTRFLNYLGKLEDQIWKRLQTKFIDFYMHPFVIVGRVCRRAHQTV